MLDAVRVLAVTHPVSGTAPQVTISICSAAAVPSAIESPELLLRRADEALYCAKADGRDGVVAASARES
jgi:PleD family two-component response regulator